MADPSAAQTSETSNTPARQARCRYCGAALLGEFYFCVRCATPYKTYRDTLPEFQPSAPTDGELIAMKAPNAWGMFWAFLSVVVGAAVVSHFLFGGERLGLQLVFQWLALSVLMAVLGTRHWRSLAVQLRRPGFMQWEAYAGLVILAGLLAINYAFFGWLRGHGAEIRSAELEMSRPAAVALLCVCPAIIEELAFRGLLQHWLQVAIAPWKALVLASALFTALHFSPLSAPYLFLGGLALGWVKLRTGSLYPSMLLHFIHNYVVITYFWV